MNTPSPTGKPGLRSRCRVRTLVVDDSELMPRFLSLFLKREGQFELAGTAADGRQALLAALASRPELILMDVQMPMLDGLQATRIIKQVGAQIGYEPVIVIVTGEDTLDCRAQAKAAGADGFVPKGVHLAVQLKSALEKLFARNGDSSPVKLMEEVHETTCA